MRKVWDGCTGCGNDSEVSACVVDRACDRRHRRHQEKQDTHSVAVVNPVFLPGGYAQHLLFGRAARLSVFEPCWKTDADLYTVPDRRDIVAGSAAQSGPAA